MTVKEKLVQFTLIDNGMWPEQAEKVFEQALPQLEGSNGYYVTWDRPSDEYPDAMYVIWAIILKPIALEWIDANQPKAWFRSMFTPDPKAELDRLQAEIDLNCPTKSAKST